MLFETTETGGAGTKEWRARTKDMLISAYVQGPILGVSDGDLVPQVPVKTRAASEEPVFGTRIRETVEAAKRILHR